MISKKQKQQKANEKYDKKIKNGDLHLIKARLTQEEINLVNQLKHDEGIATNSSTLKYIINGYFDLSRKDELKGYKERGKQTNTKSEDLNEEIEELKASISQLTKENKKLKMSNSELPFEEKLKNYAGMVIDQVIEISESEPESNISLGELHLNCDGFPKDIVDLYQNEFFDLIDTYMEEGMTKKEDDIVDCKRIINVSDFKDNLVNGITESAYISFCNHYNRKDHKYDIDKFSKWYKKALNSSLNEIELID